MKKASPVVSILIPAYNAAPFIADTIKCLQAQSLDSWEAVIVDDCSTDGTNELITEFSKTDPRIVTLRINQHIGVPHIVRVMACELARGRYVMEVDADDTISPETLQLGLDALSGTEANIAIPWLYTSDNTDERVLPSPNLHCRDIELLDTNEVISQTLNGWGMSLVGLMTDRERYLSVAQKFAQLRSIHADEIFSRLLVVECGTIAYYAGKYFYRLHDGGITSRRKNRHDVIALFRDRWTLANELSNLSIIDCKLMSQYRRSSFKDLIVGLIRR